jgi:hypothetical protein
LPSRSRKQAACRPGPGSPRGPSTASRQGAPRPGFEQYVWTYSSASSELSYSSSHLAGSPFATVGRAGALSTYKPEASTHVPGYAATYIRSGRTHAKAHRFGALADFHGPSDGAALFCRSGQPRYNDHRFDSAARR